MNIDKPSIALSSLTASQEAVIVKVQGHGAFRRRIGEMGFVRGQKVSVIKTAPMLDPIEYSIMGYKVALRRAEAEHIEVSLLTDDDNYDTTTTLSQDSTSTHIHPNRFYHDATHTIHVALVGNPNCGKTSIYNTLTGSRDRVGNYSGVTVDVRTATTTYKGYTIHISDLPGTYSLTEYSPEELYVRHHIVENMPDVVVNVTDASNIERNLFLTTELIDMDLKVVMALNMYDELERSHTTLDYNTLGSMIGIPIIPTSAREGSGMESLLDTIIAAFENNEPSLRHVHINYGQDIEKSIHLIQKEVRPLQDLMAHYSARYVAIKLLEDDQRIKSLVEKEKNYPIISSIVNSSIQTISRTYDESVTGVITDAKYGFIAGALSETMKRNTHMRGRKVRDLDTILTHKWLGFPIFFAIMFVMFEATFSLGAYPMQWIESGIEWIGSILNSSMSDSLFKSLLIDGVINGVGGVIVFLPNILILYFFMSLMEDTGYLSRAAFIMDRMMHRIGLHGKSFIPLLMGFGCNVPAIMATRTLESRKDRILTMLIIPFTSCSARLPVYILLVSAFFPHHGALVLFGIYTLGIIVGIISSLILKKIFFSRSEAPFVMELPPYRIPSMRSVARHMWEKATQYLRKMGTVILFASVLIWAASYFPIQTEYSRDYDSEITAINNDSNIPDNVKDSLISRVEIAHMAERHENSYMGRIGHAIEPVIAPLGFNWQVGCALLTGFAAKEVVVSTLAVLAHSPEEDLSTSLRELKYTQGAKKGENVFSPLVALSLMVFILLYFPCTATITAIGREAGWRWAIFSAIYTTSIAYILSLAIYQIGKLLA